MIRTRPTPTIVDWVKLFLGKPEVIGAAGGLFFGRVGEGGPIGDPTGLPQLGGQIV